MRHYCPVCDMDTNFSQYSIHPHLNYCGCCGTVFAENLMAIPTSKEDYERKKRIHSGLTELKLIQGCMIEVFVKKDESR